MRNIPENIRLYCLHFVAQTALRWRSPMQAVAIVKGVARRMAPLRNVEEARAADNKLRESSTGTCLSRAMAVAARLPDAEVVIGVDPWRSSSISAHAWVEVGGVPLEQTQSRDFSFGEIARLRLNEIEPRSNVVKVS